MFRWIFRIVSFVCISLSYSVPSFWTVSVILWSSYPQHKLHCLLPITGPHRFPAIVLMCRNVFSASHWVHYGSFCTGCCNSRFSFPSLWYRPHCNCPDWMPVWSVPAFSASSGSSYPGLQSLLRVLWDDILCHSLQQQWKSRYQCRSFRYPLHVSEAVFLPVPVVRSISIRYWTSFLQFCSTLSCHLKQKSRNTNDLSFDSLVISLRESIHGSVSLEMHWCIPFRLCRWSQLYSSCLRNWKIHPISCNGSVSR